MKRIKIFLGMMFLFLCLTNLQITVEASPQSKALSAYGKFLSKVSVQVETKYKKRTYKMKEVRFALLYMDNDNVPELVLYFDRADHVSGFGAVYSYKNGKVKQLRSLVVCNGFGYYPKTGIYEDNYAGMGMKTIYLYNLNGSKKELSTCYFSMYEPGKYYTIGNKEVAKKEYTKYVRKITKGKKKSKVRFIMNTSDNRRKYLK